VPFDALERTRYLFCCGVTRSLLFGVDRRPFDSLPSHRSASEWSRHGRSTAAGTREDSVASPPDVPARRRRTGCVRQVARRLLLRWWVVTIFRSTREHNASLEPGLPWPGVLVQSVRDVRTDRRRLGRGSGGQRPLCRDQGLSSKNVIADGEPQSRRGGAHDFPSPSRLPAGAAIGERTDADVSDSSFSRSTSDERESTSAGRSGDRGSVSRGVKRSPAGEDVVAARQASAGSGSRRCTREQFVRA